IGRFSAQTEHVPWAWHLRSAKSLRSTGDSYRTAAKKLRPEIAPRTRLLSAAAGAVISSRREQGASRAFSHGVAMSSQKNGATVLDKSKNYRPSEKEPFMNERQREYFRQKLLTWKDEILKEAKETVAHLQAESENHPDLDDR